MKYPIVICGSGISGLSAAIYAGRANNNPLVVRGDEPGGQLTLTTEVANYPGFEEPLSGPELTQKMEEQAKKFGAGFENGIVEKIRGDAPPYTVSLSDGTEYEAESIIVASGASARTLGVPGEDELLGYGVSTCAVCDGAFFKGKDMLVVGGGDAAMEESQFLTKFANKVYIAHRREELRAEAYWKER